MDDMGLVQGSSGARDGLAERRFAPRTFYAHILQTGASAGPAHTYRTEDAMRTIRLNVDALEIKSFITGAPDTAHARDMAPTYITSAVSETDGMFQCKSCGPCCQ
jgi:hypothetical protein